MVVSLIDLTISETECRRAKALRPLRFAEKPPLVVARASQRVYMCHMSFGRKQEVLQIRCKEVRVIGEEGQQLGVMALRDALNMAKDAGVDLVMVSPSANPPVCRIVDYGKFKYEQLRREKEAKKKQKTVEVKEVRLSPNIDVNDLNTKCNSARKFIEKGNKVKVSLRFRGREMAHIDSTKHILEDFAEKLSDIAVIEKAPKMEGRSMMMFLTEKR